MRTSSVPRKWILYFQSSLVDNSLKLKGQHLQSLHWSRWHRAQSVIIAVVLPARWLQCSFQCHWRGGDSQRSLWYLVCTPGSRQDFQSNWAICFICFQTIYIIWVHNSMPAWMRTPGGGKCDYKGQLIDLTTSDCGGREGLDVLSPKLC